MYKTITESSFIDAFQSIRPDNFTYEGLSALFDYFIEYEDSTGEAIELDVIAICCEFCQYASLEEFQADYGNEEYTCIGDIEGMTTLIPVGTEYATDTQSFIIQSF